MKTSGRFAAALCAALLAPVAYAQGAATTQTEHCVARQSVVGSAMRMPSGEAAVIKTAVRSPEKCKDASAPMLATFEPRTATNQTVWIDPVVGKVADAEAASICRDIQSALERGTAKQYGELLARYSDTDVTAARCAELRSRSGAGKP